ncbi:MAG: lasso peptide isopeptide bond-forming cyclase [Thermosynechococcaceae cyanobacterium]
MSGIAGQYRFDRQPIAPKQLEQMLECLAHRGPDKQEIWHEQHIGLAHCLLQTTPESLAEHQPVVSASTGCVIIADLRIDNREELIERLHLTSHAQLTDVDIVLAAYEQWGKHCPASLLGAFAFALWDPQKQRLFCARDHFGIKPFYYYTGDALALGGSGTADRSRTFVFASEIKAILGCLSEPCPINESRIAEFVRAEICDRTGTIYQGIHRLLPGHWLSVTPQGLQTGPYWELQPQPELSLASDQDYADAFLMHFTEAVRCRLRSTTAIGSHLSGGLDSSAVTCVARQLLQGHPEPLQTFSNVFEAVPECDEREYINPVLEQGDVTPHFIHPDRVGPLSQWQQLIQPEEEPCLIGGNGYLVRGLNEAVKAQNIRVCLDGFDGDTTVSHGLLYFAELAAQGRWSTFAKEARGLTQVCNVSLPNLVRQYAFAHLKTLAQQHRWRQFAQAVNRIHQHFRVSRKQLWLQIGLKTLIPEVLLNWRNSNQEEQDSLLSASFCDRLQTHGFTLETEAEQPTTPQEEQLQIFASGEFCHILEQVDLQAAACSIEMRHPFMDKRLIEFCLALPSPQRLRGGWSRLIMRHALEGIFPAQVQWRGGKTVMTPSFLKGLLRFNQELLASIFSDQAPPASRYINWPLAQAAYRRLVSGVDISDADQQAIWKAATLSLWLGCDRTSEALAAEKIAAYPKY